MELKPTSVAAAIMAAPASAAGADNVVSLDAARKPAEPQQGDFNIEAAGQPADRPALAFGRVQVAALVLVQGQNVASIPPQVFASVVFKDSPDEIVALVGPEKDIESVRDAVLFSKAFELRAALRDLVGIMHSVLLSESEKVMLDNAKKVLEESDPHFLAVTPVKTAEQKLAEATANYDPSQTPSTAGILGDVASTLEVGHDGVAPVLSRAVNSAPMGDPTPNGDPHTSGQGGDATLSAADPSNH